MKTMWTFNLFHSHLFESFISHHDELLHTNTTAASAATSDTAAAPAAALTITTISFTWTINRN